MSKKKCKKGWKWVKVGENPKVPYSPCGRSIKTYARGNNDAPSVTKYGSPVWVDAQIGALHRLHCARTALRAPPLKAHTGTLQSTAQTNQWSPSQSSLLFWLTLEVQRVLKTVLGNWT